MCEPIKRPEPQIIVRSWSDDLWAFHSAQRMAANRVRVLSVFVNPTTSRYEVWGVGRDIPFDKIDQETDAAMEADLKKARGES